MRRIVQFIKIACCLGLYISVTGATAQDITASGGTLTVSKENSGGPTAGEGSSKVVDNNFNSKFLTGFESPFWMQFQANTPAVLAQYTLTSGNDATSRDPKTWTLAGSNDGTTWTELDARTNETFPSRRLTRVFYVNNTTAYTHYRINITANNGDGNFQLTEWRLLEQAVPAAPIDLTAGAAAGDEISLSWSDVAITENGYEIERSEGNAANYISVATLAANATSYTDKGLKMNTRYYYRVRALNPYGASPFSNPANVSTFNLSGEVRDVTDNGGTLTVSHENRSGADAGEGSLKLIDNNKASKFLVFGAFPAAPGLWMQYESTTNDEVVNRYSITSGNDAPGRDAKDWVFEGSNNGTEWVVLDTRTNQAFSGRNQTRHFTFTNEATYTFFRWRVTANNGETGIALQVSELEIWGISKSAPAVPTALAVTDVTQFTISLAWNDVSTNESGFEVQRSTDGTNFTKVATVEAGATTYTDTNLRVLTQYFYRVRAVNDNSNSIFSQVASGTTLYDENLPLPVEDLLAAPVSDTEVKLTWSDRADNETGYEIERSRDGVAFTKIADLETDATEYNDAEGLKLASRYYYRIRPYNEYSIANSLPAPYSDVAQVVTTGVNQSPAFAELQNVENCNVVDVHKIPVGAITNGPEPDQAVSLSVSSNKAAMFSELSVSEVENGAAVISYKLVPGQLGEAVITVRAKDDGGTLNGGNDTFARTFTIKAYELGISVASSVTEELVQRGEIVELTATGDGNYTYTWAEGPGIMSGQNTDRLTIKPTQGYVYRVTASTPEGCTKEATFTIKMDGGVNLQANNILTPNGDGKNDLWVVWNVNTFPGNKVKVFDSTGRVVYEAENYGNNWDGTSKGSPLAQGVYYYIIDLGSGIPTAKGSLTIIRE